MGIGSPNISWPTQEMEMNREWNEILHGKPEEPADRIGSVTIAAIMVFVIVVAPVALALKSFDRAVAKLLWPLRRRVLARRRMNKRH